MLDKGKSIKQDTKHTKDFRKFALLEFVTAWLMVAPDDRRLEKHRAAHMEAVDALSARGVQQPQDLDSNPPKVWQLLKDVAQSLIEKIWQKASQHHNEPLT